MDLTGPGAWEADAVLRDGRTVHLRSIRPDDAPFVIRFHERQSQESIYFRFFSPRPRLSDRELRHFTTVDHRDRVAFVALVDDELIGVARYERYEGTDTAEVAFFVDDDHHGRGLATLMLEYLAAAARENGIRRFRATTLPNNRKMLGVFAAAGYEVATQLDDGIVEVAFDLHPTEEVVAAVQHRERVAEAASVRRMLWPSTVVLVEEESLSLGDSSSTRMARHRTVGAIARSLAESGYTGTVMRVPASALDEVPEGVDLVVVPDAVAAIGEVVEACGRRAVGAAVVLGAADADAARAMLAAARRSGLRLLGPGSVGVSNTDPSLRLHTMSSVASPLPGSIGLFSESGEATSAILDHARRIGLGLSTVVSAERSLDIDVADLLSYWADDPDTTSVLLHLAPGALPARFLRAARSASMSKPVVALHERGSPTRRRRPVWHRRDEAMLRQGGVVAVATLQELFAIGRILTDQPTPTSRAVAVVGTTEGAVGLTAAACAAAGLDVARRAVVVDDHAAGLAEASADGVGALVVVDATPGPEQPGDLAAAMLTASRRRPELTVVGASIGGERPLRLVDDDVAIPVFTFPEHAANAITRLVAVREWRSTARVYGEDAVAITTVDAGRRLTLGWMDAERSDRGEVRLDLARQEELLATFGIAVAPRRSVISVDEAVAAADEIGWPVVLKARRRDRRKRTALGGVALDLAGAEDMRSAWTRMEAAFPSDDMLPAVVQQMVGQGIDVAVRVERQDGVSTVEVGLGGPASSFDPWELGVLPLHLADAGALVSASSVGRALTDPLERVPVIALVHRLAAMVESLDRIRSVRADPVVVAGPSAWVADVEIVLAEGDVEPPIRHLE